METPFFQMPGYKIYDYLLILHPPEELNNRILQIKKEVAHALHHPFSDSLKPHIALVKFQQLAMMEEKLVNRLKIIAMAVAPFKIELRDFGTHPSHTLFIKVTTELPVRNLVKEIKTVQHLLKVNSTLKPHFIEDPEITIARKLRPWQYEQAWQQYSHKKFTGRFIADNLLLLRKPSGTKQPWQILQTLPLSNLPLAVKQAGLFA